MSIESGFCYVAVILCFFRIVIADHGIYDITSNGFVWDFDGTDWNLKRHQDSNTIMPYFAITIPKDTTIWNMGDLVTIEWTSYHHLYNTVTLSLWTNKNEKVRTIAHSADDTGNIKWLVDIPVWYSVDTLFNIRISSTAFTHTYSQSLGYIRINHPH